MVAVLPVILVLGLASSRRDLARHRSTSPDDIYGRVATSSSASSPVKAKDANRSKLCCGITCGPRRGRRVWWPFRGGGRHGISVAEAAGMQLVVSPPGPQEKAELQQYSVALAQTHVLRRERDRAIKDAISPLAHMYLSATKPGQHNRWMSSPFISSEARQAQKRYLLEAGKIIRSTGLSTNRYNELSRIVGKRKDLRDRVWRQAYLYRTKGAFAVPRIPTGGGNEIVDGKTHVRVPPGATAAGDRGGATNPANARPDDRQGRRHRHRRKGSGRRRNGGNGSRGRQVAWEEDTKPYTGKKTIVRYVKSLREIEALRLRQRKRLMTEIGCDELPTGLCQASMERVASSRVRKECQNFPVQAESIVEANGLKPEEFNRLSARSRANLLYRWLVRRCIRQVEKSERTQSPRR